METKYNLYISPQKSHIFFTCCTLLCGNCVEFMCLFWGELFTILFTYCGLYVRFKMLDVLLIIFVNLYMVNELLWTSMYFYVVTCTFWYLLCFCIWVLSFTFIYLYELLCTDTSCCILCSVASYTFAFSSKTMCTLFCCKGGRFKLFIPIGVVTLVSLKLQYRRGNSGFTFILT